MRLSMAVAALFLTGCAASINVRARPDNADVYVTQYQPNASEPPVSYVSRGTGSVSTTVNYFAWDSYYLWVGAPGYQTHVEAVPGEAKVGPIIGGIFCLFPFMWAYGPSPQPTYVELQPNTLDKASN